MTWTSEKQREYMRDYYKKNIEKWSRKNETPEHKKARLAKAREYQARNKEKIKAQKAADRERINRVQYAGRNLKKYGLTTEIFEATLQAQNGECAICQKPMTKPAVDHCHETGWVRALLCGNCNTGLGLFREDVGNLRAAIAYLETWTSIVAARKAA